MRQPGKNNRQRGRGRRNGNGNINRNTTLDSNGPDVRLRGNAFQLYEKYVSLANDASAAGERISAEAYFQHADHYFRVHSTIIAATEERRTNFANGQNNSGQDQAQDASAGDTQPAPVKEVAAEEKPSSDADAADEETATKAS
jgi:hypothetical protein